MSCVRELFVIQTYGRAAWIEQHESRVAALVAKGSTTYDRHSSGAGLGRDRSAVAIVDTARA